MKIEIKKDEEGTAFKKGEIYGIELIPENEKESKILERFWDEGIGGTAFTHDRRLELDFNFEKGPTIASCVERHYLLIQLAEVRRDIFAALHKPIKLHYGKDATVRFALMHIAKNKDDPPILLQLDGDEMEDTTLDFEEQSKNLDKKTLAKIDTFAKEKGITRASAVRYCIDSVLIDTFGKQFVHIKRDTDAPIRNYASK